MSEEKKNIYELLEADIMNSDLSEAEKATRLSKQSKVKKYTCTSQATFSQQHPFYQLRFFYLSISITTIIDTTRPSQKNLIVKTKIIFKRQHKKTSSPQIENYLPF